MRCQTGDCLEPSVGALEAMCVHEHAVGGLACEFHARYFLEIGWGICELCTDVGCYGCKVYPTLRRHATA